MVFFVRTLAAFLWDKVRRMTDRNLVENRTQQIDIAAGVDLFCENFFFLIKENKFFGQLANFV